MLPRAIRGVTWLDRVAKPFKRFKQFARLNAAVPKSEVTEKEEFEGRLTKTRAGRKRVDNVYFSHTV